MEHERQLSESFFQPLNNFRNRFCQPCFCYVTHAQSCHRFKIINGENVQYLIFLKQKILASSIDTFHCPCPPHITPPVVNGPSVTMKIFIFFYFVHLLSVATLYHVEQLSLSLAPQRSAVAQFRLHCICAHIFIFSNYFTTFYLTFYFVLHKNVIPIKIICFQLAAH